MTPFNEQQPDRIHEERREQIKSAALKVFALRGIAGTKMSMIAAEAGISQGLSYRYFNSKEELFTLLVEEAMERAQEAVQNIAHLPGTPVEQIRALTIRMLDASHKHYFLLLQQAQASDEVPAKAKQIIAAYSPQDTIGGLIPLFVKGQQTGDFCAGDPYQLLFLYFSVITGLMLQEAHSAEGHWLQDVDILMKMVTK
ncbi:TetR/AcrR family transcriptional regulator [Paenibacillus beijingensis]|uniref:TetR family transcriptional regulator n=1 Tax=Paenibacillus beijingensis TaxID=1126833 RepID=A0A0D5NG00_9BACL|nr:TetR/AcrR family transcriptional regulator [Paenibacillus beijingensis]AJY73902.1 TetR family transcriptional regulator [Paenibacillus beijingensis]